jgi:hypothetical protein
MNSKILALLGFIICLGINVHAACTPSGCGVPCQNVCSVQYNGGGCDNASLIVCFNACSCTTTTTLFCESSIIDTSGIPNTVLGCGKCSLLNLTSIVIICTLVLTMSALYAVKGLLIGGIAGVIFFAAIGWLQIPFVFTALIVFVGLLLLLANRRNPQ